MLDDVIGMSSRTGVLARQAAPGAAADEHGLVTERLRALSDSSLFQVVHAYSARLRPSVKIPGYEAERARVDVTLTSSERIWPIHVTQRPSPAQPWRASSSSSTATGSTSKCTVTQRCCAMGVTCDSW